VEVGSPTTGTATRPATTLGSAPDGHTHLPGHRDRLFQHRQIRGARAYGSDPSALRRNCGLSTAHDEGAAGALQRHIGEGAPDLRLVLRGGGADYHAPARGQEGLADPGHLLGRLARGVDHLRDALARRTAEIQDRELIQVAHLPVPQAPRGRRGREAAARDAIQYFVQLVRELGHGCSVTVPASG
jgi:hypothetical protein